MKERNNSRNSKVSNNKPQVKSNNNSGSNTPRGAKSRQTTSRSSNVLDTPELLTPVPNSSRQEKRRGLLQRSSTVNDKRPPTRDGLNASKITGEEVEEEEEGPTLEERRKQIIQKYYHEVRARAKEFVAQRQAGPKRLQRSDGEDGEEVSEEAKCLSAMEMEIRLPTIEESKDELKSTTHGTEENASVTESKSIIDKMTVDPGDKPEEVLEMEKEAESGIVMDEDDNEGEPELSPIEKQAIHEAVWDGQMDLLDDLLDLPGANINVIWFGENLLMTAIRAGQTEVSAYLIDNGINVNYQVPRFEKRDDMEVEIEKKTAEALEKELEEQKNKKKKKKNKEKEKDKEKLALEQLEKEMEEKAQIKTPELNPSSAFTDLDFFHVSCRDMAVECEQVDIMDLIDEKNGQLWPENLVPRKKREIKLKRDKMEKIIERDDWIHSEDELDSEDESLLIGKTESIRTNSRKNSIIDIQESKNSKKNFERKDSRTRSDSVTEKDGRKSVRTRNDSVPADKAESRNRNSVADTSRSPQKMASRQKGRLSESDHTKLTASKEKFTGDVTGITVAGETECQSPSPVPTEVPIEYICHCPDEGPTELRYPYRGTRSFLSRKSANERYKDFDYNSRPDKREFVKSRGSFTFESQAWSPEKVSKKRRSTSLSLNNSSERKTVKKSSSKGYIKIVDSYNNDLRYEQLRPASTRKISPWSEDDPEALTNLMKRSKSQLTLPTGKGSRPSIRRDGSDMSNNGSRLLRTMSIPAFGGAVRTNSKLYEGVTKPSKSRTVPSTPNKELRSSDAANRKMAKPPENILRQNSDITYNRFKVRPATQSKSIPRHSKTGQSHGDLLSVLEGKNQPSRSAHPDKTWAQKLLTVNKYQQIRRYSPAGYLKGGHTNEELEHLNLITLQEQKKKNYNTVITAVS